MEITGLKLKKFRNYEAEDISFSGGLNVLRGRNAQGKTNVVEAVFLCCVGKSPRTNRDRELIMWESDASYIKAIAKRSSGTACVEIYFTRRDKKRIQVNGIPINRMGELMGNIKAVYFNPDDLKLVKESPDCRRRFLDIDLSQLKKSYFYCLNHYNRILQQRNNLLKSGRERTIVETLAIWDEQLSKYGARLVTERKNFCQMLKGYAEEVHSFLTEGTETLLLEYEASSKLPDEAGEKELIDLLRERLEKSVEKDVRLGYTTVGPHRDDIKITANGVDLRQYGSQGQQRTAALSMKLAELELFARLCGEYPVLLLDDVLSELDKQRQRKLMQKIGDGTLQTILTCTEFDMQIAGGIPYRILDVENGHTHEIGEPGK